MSANFQVLWIFLRVAGCVASTVDHFVAPMAVSRDQEVLYERMGRR
jgi:hypothetical protein